MLRNGLVLLLGLLTLTLSFTGAEAAVGDYLFQWGADYHFIYPWDTAVDSNGNVYVLDKENNLVQVFNNAGTLLAQWGEYGQGDGQFYDPEGIAVDGNGNVYVADTRNNRIQVFSSSAKINRDRHYLSLHRFGPRYLSYL
jgi:tripartite motif-containing protein 71